MFFFCSPKVKPASRQPDRARIEESEGTISLTVVFPLGRHHPITNAKGGSGVCTAVPARRSTGQPRGRAHGSYRHLFAALLWGRASTEATDMIVQQHWFREQRPIVRSMIGFVVIATVLCLLLGPVGILYALGLEVLYLLTVAFAALLDPDEY
jgi:hypothetical protein